MTATEAANKIHRAIWGAKYACGILGNAATRDFELVDLDGPPLAAEIDADFRQRAFCLLGVLAIGEDGPRSAFLDDCFDDASIHELTVKFLKLYQAKLLAKALMSLPKGMVN